MKMNRTCYNYLGKKNDSSYDHMDDKGQWFQNVCQGHLNHSYLVHDLLLQYDVKLPRCGMH